jgi:hypothetical protein
MLHSHVTAINTIVGIGQEVLTYSFASSGARRIYGQACCEVFFSHKTLLIWRDLPFRAD